MNTVPVNIVVAHALEARPLAALFKMKKIKTPQPFVLYENQAGCRLIISGMGKMKSAAAVAWLAGLQHANRDCERGWLNIGIAGHKSAGLGTGMLVNKITDAASGACEYPSMLLTSLAGKDQTVTIPSSGVITVDQAETVYPENAAYEMEAWGFYSVAKKIAASELIQLYKIISDNPQSSISAIDQQSIAQWFNGNLQVIEGLVRQLAAQVLEYNKLYGDDPVYLFLANKMNLSSTYAIQLRRLCQRYQALGLGDLRGELSDKACTSAKQLISEIENLLLTKECQ